MDCGTSMVKYVLFVFNTLVSVAGILGIVYAVLILDNIGIIEVDGQYGFPPQAALPIVTITICSIVVFIAFLGCCGAIRESVCMTMSYSVFLLILLILQSVIVVNLYLYKDEFLNSMSKFIDMAWEQELKEPGIFESIQQSFKCCGKNGSIDYVANLKIPPSSCCPSDSTCVLNYYEGCRGKFQNFMSGNTEHVKTFGIVLIAIELVGFIFGCCLANNIRTMKRQNRY